MQIRFTFKTLLTTSFILFTFAMNSQSNIAIGEWKSYLPYQKGVYITQNQNNIIYATDWSIFTINKEDGSKGFLTKVEGLSDTGISHIEYDMNNEQLIVGYNNSNIDIVRDDQVINVSDLLTNGNIVGDRSVEDIHIADGQYAYLGTAFGIVQLNTQNLEFGFTVFTDLRIYDITTIGDIIYAATDDGVYYNNLATTNNPADFSTWQLIDESYGMPVLYGTQVIGHRENDIYIATQDSLYKGNLSGFKALLEIESDYTPEFINTDEGIVMLGLRQASSFSKILFLDENDHYLESPAGCVNRVRDVLIDEQNRVWYGDEWDGIRMGTSIEAPCTKEFINSPFSHQGSDISFKNDVVYVASGGVTEGFGFNFSNLGYFELNENQWINNTFDTNPNLKEADFFNLYTIAAHPTQDKLYMGSFWAGLLERDMTTDTYTLFDVNNSSLQTDAGDTQRIKITDLEFDDDGNLWVTNFGAQRPISVYTTEGTWHSFNITANDRVADVTIDNNGYKWVVIIGNSGGLLIYDDNGTIADPTDDRQRFLNVGNSTISTNLVNCVATDLNGDVWLGTAEGPIVFECGSNAFDLSGCQGTRRKVLQDSIAAFLLQTEDIRAIAIDGANRKWFGTRRGIFVQSADGETQVLKLDIDNSPLLDNTINTLEYNGSTGEMFIITDKGMQAYKTNTTDPSSKHVESNIYAYPNPVRPGYNGPIAIKGLVEDARVKITDINGKLVYETIALGGQAIWDGRDYLGTDVATGVYLVFSSSRDNFRDPDAYATKVMVVR